MSRPASPACEGVADEYLSGERSTINDADRPSVHQRAKGFRCSSAIVRLRGSILGCRERFQRTHTAVILDTLAIMKVGRHEIDSLSISRSL